MTKKNVLIEAVVTERDKLRAAVRRYLPHATHSSDCNYRASRPECRCGLWSLQDTLNEVSTTA